MGASGSLPISLIQHSGPGRALAQHAIRTHDAWALFFEEAVLMMKLPKRYATPLEGGAGLHQPCGPCACSSTLTSHISLIGGYLISRPASAMPRQRPTPAFRLLQYREEHTALFLGEAGMLFSY